jgi:hypothetical protein
MGRKKGLDQKKIATIIGVLVRNPDGIWLRRIASDAKLSPMTVSHYLNTVLAPFVEETTLGGSEKPHLRVIRLKPIVIEKLEEGKDIQQIMKILNIMNKINS